MVLDRKQLEERIRKRLKTKLELETQLKEIEMKRLQRKQEEDRFRDDQLKLLAEQDRLELLTRERQRVKKQEHYRRVREMLTAREKARNDQIFELIQEHNEVMALERRRLVNKTKVFWLLQLILNINLVTILLTANSVLSIFRQEIFAMERKKILQQHADDIIGYLPQELLQ